jgi:DNA-binding MarR family transcriptional regulator
MSRTDSETRARAELTAAILDLYSAFCSGMLINSRDSWLSLDLTVSQLKVVLIVTSEHATTGQIARRLGVALPSATRLVDRLVEHGLVTREEDPHDRRYTNVLPTSAARELIESLNAYRRDSLGAMLAELSISELREVQRGLSHLVAACPARAQEAAVAKEDVRG